MSQKEITKDNLKAKAERIKLFIMDVDGVLTDGRIILGEGGQELKFFHVQDGAGIKLAQRAGIKTAIITGRSSQAVTRRAEELDIGDVYQGIADKAAVLEELLDKHGLSLDEAAYIGDDLTDLSILSRVGLSLTVANGVAEVKEEADYITESLGGAGAIREAIELVLKLQGVWTELLES
ncbi:KdsC family phosphatase [Acetohalobium arabaticum]|uniref:3-deoxy-D-manno-octulosonate 8-phosphate phosphatase, YrbI family n=1 Tax=Acetohalobium arabaticum (strain ATCC 49924 / DSM 5501 / Z-7288) TaxID=574087 RepID=D9QTU7_ACEAZ|nr:HAD-IIIA family hydrolase [Acetohalobium arabaticum]ADL13668.1 3-deoxy-D-manno-octulosonate 8-phosphate phosphatase, YrbI family [Acetohalobium arabaticum DSM 5501]